MNLLSSGIYQNVVCFIIVLLFLFLLALVLLSSSIIVVAEVPQEKNKDASFVALRIVLNHGNTVIVGCMFHIKECIITML